MPSCQSGWASSTVPHCQWARVECDASQRVSAIGLDFCGVTGTLPANISQLVGLTRIVMLSNEITGPLPPEWASLPLITSIDLQYNRLNGTLPKEWGLLPSVEEVLLNDNKLSGSLPAEWRQLRALRTLALGSNALSGTLPAEWNQLSLLTSLFLDGNPITGDLPAQWATGMSSIEHISFVAMNLTGPLPSEWSNMTTLRNLLLAQNKLTGTLPAAWSGLKNLTHIDLSSNQFTGVLPSEWSAWSRLESLRMRAAFFLGDASSRQLPAAWKALTSLRDLHIQDDQVTGTLPDDWWEMRELSLLSLHGNAISGTLPKSWGMLQKITNIIMFANQIEGELPITWANLSQIEIILLRTNKLTGTVPAEWGELSLLRTLELHSNNLNGTLPDALHNLSSLVLLQLNENRFTGTVPQSWNRIGKTATSGTEIRLFTNYLCDDVATAWWSNNTRLHVLYQPQSCSPSITARPRSTATNSTVSPKPTTLVNHGRTSAAHRSPSRVVQVLGSTTSIVALGLQVSSGAASMSSEFLVSLRLAFVARRVQRCNAGDTEAEDTMPDVGSLVIEHPLQFRLPGTTAYPITSGAVLGNTLLMLLCPFAVTMALKLFESIHSAHVATNLFVRMFILVLSAVINLLHVPTVQAVVVLSATVDQGLASGVSISGLGMLTSAVPVALLALLFFTQLTQWQGKKVSMPTRSSKVRTVFGWRRVWDITERLSARNSVWRCTSRSSSKSTWDLVAKTAMSSLLDGCRTPHSWVLAVDVAFSVAQGVMLGVVSLPTASCSVVIGVLWSLFALSSAVAVMAVVMRPRSTLRESLFQAGNSIWSAIAALLAAMGDPDGGDVTATCQSILQLLWGVAWTGVAIRRHGIRGFLAAFCGWKRDDRSGSAARTTKHQRLRPPRAAQGVVAQQSPAGVGRAVTTAEVALGQLIDAICKNAGVAART